MRINSIDYHVKRFDVRTEYGFTFSKSPNGHYDVVTRDVSNDIYRTRITMYDTFETLSTLLDFIKSQRDQEEITIIFDSTEMFFGADVDYTSGYSISIVEKGQINQNTWKGYELSFTLEMKTPTFTGSATLPSLDYSDHSFQKHHVYTKALNYSYEGDIFIIDGNEDHGIFTGTFYFNDSDMANLRRYHATKRGTPFYIDDIPGVTYMFGRDRNIVFPVRVRLLDIKERYEGPNYWSAQIRLAEEV